MRGQELEERIPEHAPDEGTEGEPHPNRPFRRLSHDAPSVRLTGGGSAASDEPKARNESAAPAG